MHFRQIRRLIILAALFSLFFSNSENVYAACGDSFLVGSGTQEDPYSISDASTLANLSECTGSANAGKYFKITDQIDLNVAPYNAGSGWTPIGTGTGDLRFFGTLDGQENTISGLFINRSDDYQGFFGGLAGTAKNLRFETVNITVSGQSGEAYIGAIAGYSSGAVINVYAGGDITSTGSSVGGIVGFQDTTGYLYEVESRFSISGTHSKVGGVVGDNRGGVSMSLALANITGTGGSANMYGAIIGSQSGANASTTNSYALSDSSVSANSSVGGFIGYISSGTISKSFSVATYSASDNGGGFVGSITSSPSLTSCFWSTTIAGSSSAGCTGKTTTELYSTLTYSDWDFLDTWWLSSDEPSFPSLQWQGLITIGTVVHYKAGTGGTISGTALQSIGARNTDTTSVTAVADSGYTFFKWDDDSTENPRSDNYLNGDLLVTATFTANSVSEDTPSVATPTPSTSAARRAANLRSLSSHSSNQASQDNTTHAEKIKMTINLIMVILQKIQLLLNSR